MHNIEIRSKMKSEGVFGYEIAAKLGGIPNPGTTTCGDRRDRYD